jgi:hypothetical protein
MKAELLGLSGCDCPQSSWTVQVGRDASEPGPSATTAVSSSSVDCEWAFKIKPDEAAVVSWRCQCPRPPGPGRPAGPGPGGIRVTIHTGSDAQGARPEAGQLATGGELGLSGSSLAQRLEARLGRATEPLRPAAPA